MSFHYSPKIVTNGLVLMLDTANPKSYPGSGDTWYDLSGNNHNGVLNNSPSWENGVFAFDGTNQSTRISSLPLPNEISISFFLSAPGAQYNTFTIGNYWFSLQPGSNNRFFFNTNDGTGYNTLSTPTNVFPYNVMSYVTVTAAQTSTGYTKKIYINGEYQSSQDVSAIQFLGNTTNLWLGQHGSAGFDQCDFANLKMYNRPLSDSEVLQNYEATKSRFI